MRNRKMAAKKTANNNNLRKRTLSASLLQKHWRAARNSRLAKKPPVRAKNYIPNMGENNVNRNAMVDPVFKHSQGEPGFLEECDVFLKTHMKEFVIGCPSKPGEARAMGYQRTVGLMFSEKTPCRRMLAIAQLGAGKTMMMIKVLNNYFRMPQYAKICIFPTRSTVENFWSELLKFDSLHLRWLIAKNGGKKPSIELARKMLQTTPADGPGPIRVYRYTQFGALMADLKNGPLRRYKHVFVLDEAHNMVVPAQKIADHATMSKNVKAMAAYFKHSDERLIAFTATPIVDGLDQGQKLLDIVKGDANARKSNDGFTCWYMARHPSVFANSSALPKVVKVPVYGAALEKALENMNGNRKRPKSGEFKSTKPVKNTDRYLHQSCSNLNQGKNLQLALSNPEEYLPKLNLMASKIVDFVRARNNKGSRKVLVLIDKYQGLAALAALLERAKVRVLVLEGDRPEKGQKGYETYSKNMSAFNSPANDYGATYQVAIADSATYSEGVSFMSIRMVILAAITEKYGLMLQRIGRALRSCSHSTLHPSERSLEQYMFMNVVDHSVMDGGSPDEVRFEKLEKDRVGLDKAICALASSAVDRGIMAAHGVRNSCGR